mgnify:CR=1 FL=1
MDEKIIKSVTITNPGCLTSSGDISFYPPPSEISVSYDTNQLNISNTQNEIAFKDFGKDLVHLNIPDSTAYKYAEMKIISDLASYINRTYGEHYKKDKLECLDAWIARGTADTTCLDTAEKYLWRYGSKNGKNKDDLMKALHYIMLTMYINHYKE